MSEFSEEELSLRYDEEEYDELDTWNDPTFLDEGESIIDNEEPK